MLDSELFPSLGHFLRYIAIQILTYWVMRRIAMQGSPHRSHISDAFVGFLISFGSLIFRRVIKAHLLVLQVFFHQFSDWSILRSVRGQINRLTGRHMPTHT